MEYRLVVVTPATAEDADLAGFGWHGEDEVPVDVEWYVKSEQEVSVQDPLDFKQEYVSSNANHLSELTKEEVKTEIPENADEESLDAGSYRASVIRHSDGRTIVTWSPSLGTGIECEVQQPDHGPHAMGLPTEELSSQSIKNLNQRSDNFNDPETVTDRDNEDETNSFSSMLRESVMRLIQNPSDFTFTGVHTFEDEMENMVKQPYLGRERDNESLNVSKEIVGHNLEAPDLFQQEFRNFLSNDRRREQDEYSDVTTSSSHDHDTVLIGQRRDAFQNTQSQAFTEYTERMINRNIINSLRDLPRAIPLVRQDILQLSHSELDLCNNTKANHNSNEAQGSPLEIILDDEDDDNDDSGPHQEIRGSAGFGDEFSDNHIVDVGSSDEEARHSSSHERHSPRDEHYGPAGVPLRDTYRGHCLRENVIELDGQNEDTGRSLSSTASNEVLPLEVDSRKQTRMERRKQFQCTFCGKSFRMKRYLHVHVKYACGGESFLCPICEKTFRTRKKFDKHMEQVCSYEIELKCDRCSQVYCTKAGLQRHINENCEENTFGCLICEKKFRSSLYRERHVKVCGVELQCKLCKKRFTDKKLFKWHLEKSCEDDTPDFKCNICGKVFMLQFFFKKHLEKGCMFPFVCHKCNRGFKNKQYFKRHVICCDGKPKCRKGLDVFTSKPKFGLHNKTCLKPFQCFTCPRQFIRREDLSRHDKYCSITPE